MIHDYEREPLRKGIRFVIARRVFADAWGSGFQFKRSGRRVERYWTRKGAQTRADQLNAQERSKP